MAPKTGEREQSTAKKSRSARKDDLLSFFREGARMPPPSKEGTPINAVKMRRMPGSGASSSKKKRDKTNGNDAIGRKKSKSDDEESHKGLADIEKMDETLLKPKGLKPSLKKGKAKKGKEGQTPDSGKKKATFAETVGKEVVEEKEIKYKTCVVGFAVRVERTKDTKGGFDKKLMEGLIFMQTYIDKNTSFHPIKPGTILKPIKEKGNFLKFQVTSQSYFCVPSTRAFDNINVEAGRKNRGSAIMGFTENPEQCLEEATRDLRAMGCAIFYKKCQEVDTITSQILIGMPNTIKEEIIKQMLDNKLKIIKQTLLKTNKDYKLTREQTTNWIRYAVVWDFPAGMLWEGIKEKKQKAGDKQRKTCIWAACSLSRLQKIEIPASVREGSQRLGQGVGQHYLHH